MSDRQKLERNLFFMFKQISSFVRVFHPPRYRPDPMAQVLKSGRQKLSTKFVFHVENKFPLSSEFFHRPSYRPMAQVLKSGRQKLERNLFFMFKQISSFVRVFHPPSYRPDHIAQVEESDRKKLGRNLFFMLKQISSFVPVFYRPSYRPDPIAQVENVGPAKTRTKFVFHVETNFHFRQSFSPSEVST